MSFTNVGHTPSAIRRLHGRIFSTAATPLRDRAQNMSDSENSILNLHRPVLSESVGPALIPALWTEGVKLSDQNGTVPVLFSTRPPSRRFACSTSTPWQRCPGEEASLLPGRKRLGTSLSGQPGISSDWNSSLTWEKPGSRYLKWARVQPVLMHKEPWV